MGELPKKGHKSSLNWKIALIIMLIVYKLSASFIIIIDCINVSIYLWPDSRELERMKGKKMNLTL